MRRSRATGIALALVLALAACSRGPAPARSGRIVIGTTESVTSLDPGVCYEYFCASMLLANTHEGLVRVEPGATAPSGALAESWTISDDGRTYTFTLRKGVVFHDGSPFTAATMKRSLERVKTLSSTGNAAFLLFDTTNDPPKSGIASIDATDEHTLVIVLVERDSTFLSKLAFQVASATPEEGYPSDQQARAGTVVGTGPFELAPSGYREGEYVDLDRYEGYWGQKAKSERVRIRFFKSPSALRLAVESGEIDIAFRSLNPDEIGSLRKASALDVVEGSGAVIRFLSFNVTKKPFDDVRVRRAIASALDRGEIVRKVFDGVAEPLYSMVPAGFEAHRDVFKERYGNGPDPGKVSSELGAARAPEQIPFDLWYTPTHYGDTESQVAEVIKDRLESTGRFKVTLRSSEWADYKTSFARGDFGAFLLGWFPDYLDPDDYLDPFVGTSGARALGSYYSDARVDELLVEERHTTDAARRAEIFVELQRQIAEDVPQLPLWQAKQVAVVRDGVVGVSLDPTQILHLAPIERRR